LIERLFGDLPASGVIKRMFDSDPAPGELSLGRRSAVAQFIKVANAIAKRIKPRNWQFVGYLAPNLFAFVQTFLNKPIPND